MKKIQRSLAGGELTDSIQTRSDIEKFHVGVRKCLNAQINVYGEADSRGGLEFVDEVDDSSYLHWLLKFVYSRTDAYALVLGQENMRIVKNGSVLENPPGTPIDVVTPYNATQNSDIDTAQSADIMFAAHKEYFPYELIRSSDISWAFTLINFVDGPWLAYEDGDDEITMTPSAKTGAGVTVTSSVDPFPHPNSSIAGGIIRIGIENPFDASDIEWGWATITAEPSTTTRTVTIEKDLGFEYLLNPKFENDTGHWQDRSSGVSSLTHDPVNQSLILNKGASGEAFAEQEVTVPKYERMTVEIVVDVVDTQIRIKVGTVAGAADVLGAQNITTPGTYSYTTVVAQPTTSTVFVIVESIGAPSPSTHKVSRVSLMRFGLGTPHWRFGAFTDDHTLPSHVAFHGGRLYFAGGSLRLPDTFWASRLADYKNHGFNSPLIDTDAFNYPLASLELNAIQSLTPKGGLIICTTGAEWLLTAGVDGAITPTIIDAKVKSNTGSSSISPLIAGQSVLILNANNNTVYDLSYSLDADSFDPANVSLLAGHLFEDNSIVQWAYQRAPFHTVWAVRDDGILLGLTYQKNEKIWAWHRHQTDGLFESVTVVPESGGDVVYVMVNRTIEGATKRYIEKFKPRINDAEIHDYYAVDSGITVDNPLTVTDITKANPGVAEITGHGLSNGDLVRFSKVVGMTQVNGKVYQVKNKNPNDFELGERYEGADVDTSAFTEYVSGGEARLMFTTIANLGHLEGKTVVVLADGEVVRGKTVVSGSITLDNPASLAHAGLSYNADILSMNIETEDRSGSTEGKEKFLTGVDLYLKKSRGKISVGPDFDNLNELDFTKNSAGDDAPDLVTGIVSSPTQNTALSKEVRLAIRQEDPLPLTVSGFITYLELEQGDGSG